MYVALLSILIAGELVAHVAVGDAARGTPASTASAVVATIGSPSRYRLDVL